MGSDEEYDNLLTHVDEDDDGYHVQQFEEGTDSGNDRDGKSLTIDEAIDTAGFGWFHVLMAMVMGWANSADAAEVLSISFILPQASCELKATDLELGFLTAAGFAGMMLGAYFWGTLADIKGRIRTVILCQAWNGLFIVGSSLSQSLWFLILMRFCSGFGVGGTNPLIFVYIVEIMPKHQRGRMTAVLASFFMVGQILVAGLAWYILPHTEWSWSTNAFTFNSWRMFMLISSFPVISSFLLFMLFPESPRYLAQVNKMAEAKAAIKYIYNKNRNTEPYDDNYRIIKQTSFNSGGGLRYSLRIMAKNTWNLVALRRVRYRFIYSSTVSFCLAFSYYGLTMWFPTMLDRMESSNATSVCDSSLPPSNRSHCDYSHQKEVYFDTFLQALSSLPGNMFYFLLIDKIGRKIFTGVSMIMTAICVFFIWFISSHTGSIIMSCVFAGITVVSWNAMALITSEIFPTELRSTAKGVQSALFNRVASILASVIFGALISSHCAVPILLIACLLVVGGILTYKLPNSTNAAID